MGVTERAGCAGLSVEKCRVSKRLATSIPGTTASRKPMSETISHLPPCRACPDAAHIIKGGFVGIGRREERSDEHLEKKASPHGEAFTNY